MASVPLAFTLDSIDLGASEEVASGGSDLLVRARAGDREALRSIYNQFGPPILRFLHDLFRDGARASDATQDTFDRAFRRLGAVRQPDRLGPWLFGIARFVYLEQRKSQRREQQRDDLVASAHTGGQGSIDPEQVLLAREAATAVERTLALLSDDRRTALLLRIDHGFSYRDIAELMDWSVAKAKVEVHRARLCLREELERDEIGGEG
jgi:RNA polymerase sigma-70 factor (ECF subfamily)